MKLLPLLLSTFLITSPVIIKADFDNDQDIDKIEVVVNDNEANLYYYENLGDNTFKEKKLIHNLPVTGLIGYQVADLNNNLFKDLIISTGNTKFRKENELSISNGNKTYIIWNSGSGHFSGCNENGVYIKEDNDQ